MISMQPFRATLTTLLFAGINTDRCVFSTLQDAGFAGYDCVLVDEATASYFPAFKAATIEMVVAQGGIVGWVAPLAAVLGALPPVPAAGAGSAGHAA